MVIDLLCIYYWRERERGGELSYWILTSLSLLLLMIFVLLLLKCLPHLNRFSILFNVDAGRMLLCFDRDRHNMMDGLFPDHLRIFL